MATRRWSFLLPLTLFTLCCAAALIGVLLLSGADLTAHFVGILVYFAAITAVLHGWQEQAFVTDPKGFVRRFMAGLMLKMFLSVVVLVILLLTVPKSISIALSLSFAVLYLAFLAFSTLRLMRLSTTAPKP